MKLLGEKKVKEAKDKLAEGLSNRVRKLQEEETASARRISQARDNEKKAIDEIEGNIRRAETAHKEAVSIMQVEVDGLEERKRRALEPILGREQEAERVLKGLEAREEGIKAKEDYYDERAAKYQAARREYEAKRKKLDDEDAVLRSREAKVAEDWAENDRLFNARESMLRDEKQRLRDYFEAEDDKLKEKASKK